MNCFSFLKNNAGKIAKGPLLGGVATLAGIGITLGGYQHDVNTYDNPTRSVSSLRNLRDDSIKEGMTVAADGSLTAMPDNLLANNNSVRLPSSGYKGSFTDADALGNNISYQFSQGAGGLSNVADINTGKVGDFTSGNGAGPSGAPISVTPDSHANGAGGAGGVGGEGGAGGNGAPAMTRASMAQASGNATNNSYVPGAGSGSYGGGAGGNGGGHGGNGDYDFSSSMPSSSLDSVTVNGRNSSLVGSTNSRFNRFNDGKTDSRDRLTRAALYSQKAASHGSDLSANEGGGAFLDSEGSGGVTLVDGATGGGSDGSSDLSGDNVSNINHNLGDLEDDLTDDFEKQKKARKQLIIKIVALLAGAIAIGIAMYHLISKGMKKIKEAQTKIGKIMGYVMVAAGWALMAGITAYAAIVIKDAVKFLKDFPDAGKAFPIIGIGMAAAAVATLTFVGIRATKEGTGKSSSTLTKEIKKLFTKNKGKWMKNIGSVVSDKIVDSAWNSISNSLSGSGSSGSGSSGSGSSNKKK